VYQNCVIFNNGTFKYATDKKVKDDGVLVLEHGKPMIFGKDRTKGIRLNPKTMFPEVVNIGEGGAAVSDLLVHDEMAPEPTMAFFLSRFSQPEFPEPIGVFRAIRKPTYDEMFNDQVAKAKASNKLTFNDVIDDGETWEVKTT